VEDEKRRGFNFLIEESTGGGGNQKERVVLRRDWQQRGLWGLREGVERESVKKPTFAFKREGKQGAGRGMRVSRSKLVLHQKTDQGGKGAERAAEGRGGGSDDPGKREGV